jgi:HlyD family secretion protein
LVFLVTPLLFTVFSVSLVFSVVGVLLAGCGAQAASPTSQAPVVTATAQAGPATVVPAGLSANGVLVPLRRVALSFGVGGEVASVEVLVGEEVQAGRVLATLNDGPLQHAVTRAEINLRRAEMRLERLQEEPDAAEVLLAESGLAQAAFALEAARVSLTGVLSSTLLKETLDDAAEAAADARREAEERLAEYGRGKVAYWFVDAAQQTYREAELARVRVTQQADLALAIARRDEAGARVAYLEAKRALEELREGAGAQELETVRLDVEEAYLVLDAARVDLARATLVAPFDGVVATVDLAVGEWAAPGAPVVELLDVSGWRVETRNVGELEIARVHVGQEVRVQVHAYRGDLLTGRIVTISPVAIVQQGDTTYTLTIDLEPTDLDLRTGMTVRVEIPWLAVVQE